jgi:imidazolonepropionase
MPSKIFLHISQLAGIRQSDQPLRADSLAELPSIKDAYLITEDEEIAAFGPMSELKQGIPQDSIDARGRVLLPCWCDSHTHLVYPASREVEFVDKIRGMSYAEINARGGGILQSAAKLEAYSEDRLFVEAWDRLQEVARMGTGAIEIKSGYGLTVEGELKILRVIKRLREKSSLTVKSTFLGAHSYPLAFKENHEGYIDQIIQEMLPKIAREGLADYIDVFCEEGFFSAGETERICKAGMQYGLKPRLHVNQLHSIGGIATGIKLQALSMDHLETLSEADFGLLRNAISKLPGEGGWAGICTLLPFAAFFLRMPFQPARRLIDAQCAIALASDYNPGSAPSGNMNLVVSMACIQMKLLPEEAINAATFNGAAALELEKELGSIARGKRANLILTKPIPSLAYLPYSFGNIHVEKVMIQGEFIN